MFIWKALQNALPVGEQLAIRQITTTSKCCRCPENESVFHLLFNCPFAVEVWNRSPWTSGLITSNWTDVLSGLKDVMELSTLPPTGLPKRSLYPWILWNLWTARNQKIFSSRLLMADELISKEFGEAREWKDNQITPNLDPPKANPNPPFIDPPPAGTITCHTDAAWHEESQKAGVAWILSYDQQRQSTTHSSSVEHVSSALMAEALAIRSAVMHAKNAHIKNLLLLSDSQVVLRSIEAGNLIMDLHGILADIDSSTAAFNFVRFKFIPRKENCNADLAAKLALMGSNHL
ncbi:hypothetical protein EUTSA_v10011015mg [Eutrema salsugineum]|uniref:RNase H type-1 domain-containing protein n=1 Tax=Eutrema salsugineum TaxID=72664 RepID=V4L6F4_EUTSA|nr:uncharacterized protein LOC18021269 [Eutrema salsugineum]ESQ45920.1 hypothetical protein EUTSA_v10011015mg [Eutrema salsugineum]